MREKYMKFIKTVCLVFVTVSALLMTGCNNKKDTVEEPEKKAAVLSQMSEELGYENALSELTEKNTNSADGNTYYRFQQNYQGIPVYGKTIIYAENEKGKLLSVTGNVMDVDEGISLVPSVTQETAEASVKAYAAENLGCSETEDVNVPQLTASEVCIFCTDDDNGDRLAYRAVVSIDKEVYEMVIDAESGEILKCLSLMNTEMVSIKHEGKNLDLNRKKDEDDRIYHTMVDEKRHIRIYSANGGTLTYELRNPKGELWIDEEREDINLHLLSENGITEPMSYDDPPEFETKAIKLLLNLQTTYDFWEDTIELEGLPGSGVTWVDGVYDDCMINGAGERDTGNAYCWGYSQIDLKDMLLLFDIENEMELDGVGHEYTHAVENRVTGMTYIAETGAIKEALSDIFGELIEARGNKKEPDWIQGVWSPLQRNIAEPNKSENPNSCGGAYWMSTSDVSPAGDLGGVHQNSTVISHAAYLMRNGIDGTEESKKLSLDELARVWYNALLMMSSDCDFKECRAMVELAGSNIGLNDAKLDCIAQAFDAVGIYSQDLKNQVSENVKLTLAGADGEPYGNYTLYINPVKVEKEAYVLLKEKNALKLMEQSQDVRKVTSTEPYALNLKKGVYSIVAVDNEDAEKAFVSVLQVRDDGADYLTMETDFGKDSIPDTMDYLNNAEELLRLLGLENEPAEYDEDWGFMIKKENLDIHYFGNDVLRYISNKECTDISVGGVAVGMDYHAAMKMLEDSSYVRDTIFYDEKYKVEESNLYGVVYYVRGEEESYKILLEYDEQSEKIEHWSLSLIHEGDESNIVLALGNEPEQWKQEYIKFIYQDLGENGSGEYQLINIDGNDIPELYVEKELEYKVYTFYEGSIIENELGGYGGMFSYVEGENLCRSSGGHAGVYYDYIYSIENGKLVLRHQGDYFENWDEEQVVCKWLWDDAEIASAEEYEQRLNEIYNVEKEIWPHKKEKTWYYEIIRAIETY